MAAYRGCERHIAFLERAQGQQLRGGKTARNGKTAFRDSQNWPATGRPQRRRRRRTRGGRRAGYNPAPPGASTSRPSTQRQPPTVGKAARDATGSAVPATSLTRESQNSPREGSTSRTYPGKPAAEYSSTPPEGSSMQTLQPAAGKAAATATYNTIPEAATTTESRNPPRGGSTSRTQPAASDAQRGAPLTGGSTARPQPAPRANAWARQRSADLTAATAATGRAQRARTNNEDAAPGRRPPRLDSPVDFPEMRQRGSRYQQRHIDAPHPPKQPQEEDKATQMLQLLAGLIDRVLHVIEDLPNKYAASVEQITQTITLAISTKHHG
ncbi:uncharacterized protein LOC124577354 [Schistocerca americana]|uniref:uncharacterized protein LOC124577354 n=1 Tax=Schistocerca americana TaxID=7009 RepID=UPI001F500B74|nr:uncharacterized protein LOC124577354 [Schistocerca americana]